MHATADKPGSSPTAAGSGSGSTGDDDAAGSMTFTSDLELDSDEWDQEMLGETKDTSVLELGDLDWNDINKEVEDELAELEAESDDDDERSMRSDDGWSEDGGSMSGSVNNTPTLKRKRLRSMTPSDSGGNTGKTGDDLLRSPLAKRKKLAAERTGYSKLKEGISADELKGSSPGANPSPVASPKATLQEEMDEEEDYEDDDGEEEEDFLLQAMQEEGPG